LEETLEQVTKQGSGPVQGTLDGSKETEQESRLVSQGKQDMTHSANNQHILDEVLSKREPSQKRGKAVHPSHPAIKKIKV